MTALMIISVAIVSIVSGWCIHEAWIKVEIDGYKARIKDLQNDAAYWERMYDIVSFPDNEIPAVDEVIDVSMHIMD